jgi:hypothetical protein
VLSPLPHIRAPNRRHDPGMHVQSTHLTTAGEKREREKTGTQGTLVWATCLGGKSQGYEEGEIEGVSTLGGGVGGGTWGKDILAVPCQALKRPKKNWEWQLTD